jgi:hypothetical protein
MTRVYRTLAQEGTFSHALAFADTIGQEILRIVPTNFADPVRVRDASAAVRLTG